MGTCYNVLMLTKQCEYCGKEMTVTYRVTKAYWGRRRFCSPQCRVHGTKGESRQTRGKEKRPLAERFWFKVYKRRSNECWEWGGATTVDGYGYLAGTRGEKARRSHRLSYELNIGPIPDGMCVCHHCDNRKCVNPTHLFLGTRVDNNLDCKRKGRVYDRSGERNPNAKLTADDVRKIRKLRENGLSQQKIANRFNVSQVTISKILIGKHWKA
jgi:hypothetical protein